MSTHILAIVFFIALAVQIGCAMGVEKDRRPWTAPRYGSLIAGVFVLGSAIWLAATAW